jgi:hypothetical protein
MMVKIRTDSRSGPLQNAWRSLNHDDKGGVPAMQVVSEFYISPVDTMALTPADKKWIQKEVRGGQTFKWIVGTLFSGVLVAGLLEWNHFTNENATFRQETRDRLHAVETKLNIQAALQSSPGAALSELAKLDQGDFEHYLPVLQKLTANPNEQIPASENTLKEIRYHLQGANESLPDYWPAVLQFIQFASARVQPAGVPSDNAPTLVRSSVWLDGLVFKGGKLVLDGGQVSNSRFVRCRIVFTETPVKIINTTFADCVFEMPVRETPGPYLRDATRVLLASNLESVAITSL